MAPDQARTARPGSDPARWRRWAVPPVLAGLAIAGAVVIPQAASATGRPHLRPISAQALVAKVLGTHVSTLSGDLSLTANLGLPDLSSLTGGRATNPLTFLSGTHTAQIWYGGPHKVRVAVPDGTGESDFILDGNTTWIWQSSPYTVTKIDMAAPQSRSPASATVPPASATVPPSPAQLASQLLASIGPSTAVRVSTSAYVAGRPSYELVLSPHSDASLVGQVVIAVDATTGLPLRVQVIPRSKAAPVLTYGFTRISYAPPSASNFDFTPPAGAKVSNLDPRTALGSLGPLNPSILAGSPSLGPASTPTVVGSGWATVVVIPASLTRMAATLGPAAPHEADGSVRSALSSVLDSGRALSGSWGSGHLIHTALLNVLAVTNGPILFGPVTRATLVAAAAHAH